MSNSPKDDFRPDMDMNETLTPFDAMEQNGRRAMILLVLSLGFLLLLALLIFKVYQPGIRDRDAPPTINAENTPFKYKPDNPGGEVTPDQDKEIYNAMNGSNSVGKVIPSPSAEIPITIPKTANIKVQPAVPVQGEARPAAPSPRYNSVPKPATQPTNVNSDYVVQLASVRSRGDAEKIWNDLNTKFRNDLRAPLYADIKRADLNEKGVYYRLRVAGFATQSDAKRLCDNLKARQQACFVARK